MTVILDQLSYRFDTAYACFDELQAKKFIPLKIQKYHVGWLAPEVWQILKNHPHIFQPQYTKYSNHSNHLNNAAQNSALTTEAENISSVEILKQIKDIHQRNEFFQKLQKYLLKSRYIASLSAQHFAIQSPLGDDLLHLDRACATFFGVPMPIVSMTPYFRKDGEYYYYLQYKANKWHVFNTQVLRVQETIHHALSDICQKAKIKTGAAMLINHLGMRRVTKLGLHWQEIDNYVLELPKDFNLENFVRSHAQDSQKIYAMSGRELVQRLLDLDKFHVESSILLASILQKHQMIEQLSDGLKFSKI